MGFALDTDLVSDPCPRASRGGFSCVCHGPCAQQHPQDHNGTPFHLEKQHSRKEGWASGPSPTQGSLCPLCDLGRLLNPCVTQTFHLKVGVEASSPHLQWLRVSVSLTFTLNPDPLAMVSGAFRR